MAEIPAEYRPSINLVAARQVHFTDPRVAALAITNHLLSGDKRDWHELDWAVQHLLRTSARDWLRAAVAIGLVPLYPDAEGDGRG